MKLSMRLLLNSTLCSAWFKLRCTKSSLVACQGRLPVLYTRGSVRIGNRLILRSIVAPCEIGAIEPGAELKIGDRVFINQGASILATRYIEIGRDTQIGDFSAVLDRNSRRIDLDDPLRAEPVIIGANVWLGRSVIVLPGTKIGDNSIIAAGCIVQGDIPPCVIVGGNPARIIRTIDVPIGWRRG